MKRLSPGQWFEVAFWIAFAALAYALTFQFDRDIEMYKFGASGWPRVVILLIVLSAIGQFFHHVRTRRQELLGAPLPARPGLLQRVANYGLGSTARMVIILALPVIYAVLLPYTGYYFTTPIFLGSYLYMSGERRLKWLILVPLAIYVVVTILFTRLLFVSLPVGYWPGFYDFSNWLIVLIRL